MSTPRKCERCGLTLLGWITHDEADECVMALRGKYEALKRVHRTVVRDRDSKASGMERWRERAKVAEGHAAALQKEIKQSSSLGGLNARLVRLERRLEQAELH